MKWYSPFQCMGHSFQFEMLKCLTYSISEKIFTTFKISNSLDYSNLKLWCDVFSILWCSTIYLILTSTFAWCSTQVKGCGEASCDSFFSSPIQGYLFGALSACLSALAGVYTEFLMKKNNDSLYWQNVQLYTWVLPDQEIYNCSIIECSWAHSLIHMLKL